MTLRSHRLPEKAEIGFPRRVAGSDATGEAGGVMYIIVPEGKARQRTKSKNACTTGVRKMALLEKGDDELWRAESHEQ